MTVQLQQTSFGTTEAGESVDLFTFSNNAGVTLSVTNYGGTITSVVAPDREGVLADIALGYDTLAEYESCKKFMGCVVGRYANRIKHGKFTLDSVEYQLETNPIGHHLHGGAVGFNKQVWNATVTQQNGLPLLALEHSSPAGHGGYPGKLDCKLTYRLSEDGEIAVNYHAACDQTTIANLTNHSYFNLAGHKAAVKNAILDHVVVLNCDTFLPTDDTGIPISAPISVSGTPMDFRVEKSIGECIHVADKQLQNGSGYDHNWIVNQDRNELALAAVVCDPKSGRTLTVHTTQPGIQVYTGNKVDDVNGKEGALYQRRGSLCLETQHYPDSPNNSSFPSTVVTADNPLHEVTIFRVGVR